MALLDVRNLHVYYGKIHALRGVSLALGKDQIVTLIGANGAGKSTTLRAISGILAATEGEVIYDGEATAGPAGASASSPRASSRCRKAGASSAA